MFRTKLNRWGAENNLHFSSQELLNDSILGLDVKRLKLMILQQPNRNLYEWNIIDLEMVSNCSVKKIHKPFYEGNFKTKNIDHYLDKIVLHFEFKDSRESSEINFYSHVGNNVYEMKELELKARKWEFMLLPMTGNRLNQIV